MSTYSIEIRFDIQADSDEQAVYLAGGITDVVGEDLFTTSNLRVTEVCDPNWETIS